MSLEGQHIGRYHLLHLLGSGGMGDVYLAEDARIEQQVAIKVIRTEASSSPTTDAATDAIRLFQREARAIAKLDHPNTLIAANTPNVQQVLQPKIQANEQLIGTPQCKPNVTSDHKAGDQAANVTVTVMFTCTGEVYDHAGALALAEQLLKQQAVSNPGSGYTLVGKVTTAITTSTVTQGTITLIVNAKGLWVFHFSDAQKQALAKLIAGKSKTDAQALLTAQSGVKQADITGSTLPTDPSQITIVVRSVSG